MYNCKIDKCPECGHVLGHEDVAFEETASYIPGIMWQVCPVHGKVSEFGWSPYWRLETSKKVEVAKPKTSLFFCENWVDIRFVKVK